MNVHIPIFAVLLCGLGSACGGDDFVESRPRPLEVDLVPVAGLDSVEAELVERGAVWRDRRCLRPALRSTSKPGSGAAAIDQFFRGDTVVSGCVEVLDEILGVGPDSFDWDGFLSTGDGIPPELISRLNGLCTPALDAVGEAISFEDVCSPWLPGVRADPPDRVIAQRLPMARVLLDRVTYQPVEALETMWNTLELIRFQQDLLRGGGSRDWVARTVPPLRLQQGPWVAWLLESGDLDDAALDRTIEGLSILLDSEPTHGALVAAWGYRFFVQELRPRLHGFFWAPPGGWDPGRPLRWGWERNNAWMDEDSEKVILLLAVEQHLDVLAEACPTNSELLECIRGLYALAPPDQDDDQPIPAAGKGDVERMGRAMAGPDRKGVFLEWNVDISAVELNRQAWILVEALEELSFRSLRLAQLRLHAAILRAWRTTGRCPGFADLDGVEWQALTQDPVFGGRLDVSNGAGDEWVMRSTGRYTGYRVNEWDLAYRFHCPPEGWEALAVH